MKDIERLLDAAATPTREDEEHAMHAAERLIARAAAEGLADISYCAVDSPFGTLHAAATSAGLVRLAFPE
jgi:hypothetical protein